MNDVDRWFEHAALTNTPPVTLYPSLLTGRIFGYLRYRLRYPLLIATVRFAVHVAEFFILLASLGGVAAYTVMMLRAGSLFVSGGWWGLLEILRERVRAFARAGQRDASENEIGRWLVLAVLLAVITTAAGAVVLLVRNQTDTDPVARIYAFLIIVEFAIDLPVRVLHSGIFATRRVYKPAWSMFLPTGVQLAILALGFYYYPTAAIIIAIIACNALAIGITVHYCLEVYRLMGLHPRWRPGDLRFWRHLPSIPLRLGVQTTLSGLSLRLDAILVLALVGFYGTNTRTFDLTAGLTSWQRIDAFQFFYLILPLFRGTYESAAIFYFDLVRMRTMPAIRDLQLVFFRALLWAAPAVSVFFWVLAAALGTLVLRDVPISFLLALIPMFVARSLIGVYQMRLFAEGRFRTHIATFALLAVLLWLVWRNPNPAGDLVQITAAMIVQLLVLINVQHLRDRRDPALPVLIPLRDWIRSLAGEPGPAVAGTVTIPESVTPKQKAAAVAAMRESLNGKGYFAYRSATKLLYYGRSADCAGGRQLHLEIQAKTGGAATRGGCMAAAEPDGRAALECIRDWLPARDDATGAPSDLDGLRDEFRRLFADGVVFDTETLEGCAAMRNLDPTLLATALPTAVASLEDGADTVPLSGRWLTPLYQGPTLRLLFVLPADPDPSSLKTWRATVRAWQLDAVAEDGVRG
ncbi:MAG: hypothetical protein NTY24_13620 [Mycobacterium sp.]|nr:hypothetical protein [Mycobacterium sp.]